MSWRIVICSSTNISCLYSKKSNAIFAWNSTVTKTQQKNIKKLNMILKTTFSFPLWEQSALASWTTNMGKKLKAAASLPVPAQWKAACSLRLTRN